MSGRAVVAVVGGGASGTLVVTQLARAAAAQGRRVELLVVEPAELGEGIAYSTRDPRHRLNVVARGMSALPDHPEHFLDWLRGNVDPDFPADGYAPRRDYARYLRQTCREAVSEATGTTLEQLRIRATDLRRHGRRLRLSLADGTTRPVDAAVLALGNGRSGSGWAPAALRASGRYVGDPWAPAAAVAPGEVVLLVGTGLTMVDMALRWCGAGARVHAVSRHGSLPLPHATPPAERLAPPAAPTGSLTYAEARRRVFSRLREVVAGGGDWRTGVDSLRPVTSALWSQLDDEQRRAFLRSGARRWDRVRHRIDPALHHWLEARQSDASLRVHTGTVVAAYDRGDAVVVRLTDGTEVAAAAVVNCTGFGGLVSADEDPLVMNLLASRVARPGPLDLGFATDGTGRLRAEDRGGPGSPRSVRAEPLPVWAIGPLRRGELWETTAVPELRVQAEAIGRAVVAALPASQLRRRPRDPYGLPLSASAGAAAAYTAALGRVLRVQSGAEVLIAEAVQVDEGFALGHAVRALLGAEWAVDGIDGESSLAAAERTVGGADERERRFVEVVAARVRQPGPGASAALLAYLQSYPEDALAVSLAVPTIAFGGATEIPAEAWALVEGLAPAYGSDWWYHGLLAYMRQEQARYDEALRLAERSLAAEPAAGHAVHAKAHVHYETGDHEAGLAWLDGWISSCGARAAHRAHFSWHAALHELSLGDDAAVRHRFARQLSPTDVTGVRALVDSASLLWRGHVAGAWPVLDLAPVLATVPESLLVDPPTPFVAMHAAVTLAAAGDCRRLARLRRAAGARTDPVFTDTVAPLAEALESMVQEDYGDAADQLAALRGVERLGGSTAQRELVEETLLYSLVAARRYEQAAAILDRRLGRRGSPRDRERRDRLTGLAAGTVSPRPPSRRAFDATAADGT